MIDPLNQFKIKQLVPIEFCGMDFSLTNATAFMLLSVFVVATVMILGTKLQKDEKPSRFNAFIEMIYEFISNMIRDNCGTEGLRFLPFVLSLFMFVAIGNLLGMLPYSFTFTSHIISTFTLAAIVFIFVTVLGFVRHGTKYLGIFLPGGAPIFLAPILIPIELISYLTRPISLSVRLFANMMAGHMVLKIFASFVVLLGIAGGVVPLVMTVIITLFELFVALIQAYIFSILTCVYLHDALHVH